MEVFPKEWNQKDVFSYEMSLVLVEVRDNQQASKHTTDAVPKNCSNDRTENTAELQE